MKFALAKGQLSAGNRAAADELSRDVESIYVQLGEAWKRPLADLRAWRSEAGF